MSSPSTLPDFPLAGLVLLGLLALVAVIAWARVPGAGIRWRGAWPASLSRTERLALRVHVQQRLDAFSVIHDVEWADGRRLLVCTTRGASPVVLDRSPALVRAPVPPAPGPTSTPPGPDAGPQEPAP